MSKESSLDNLYADVILCEDAMKNVIDEYCKVHGKFIDQLTELLTELNSSEELGALFRKYKTDHLARRMISNKFVSKKDGLIWLKNTAIN